MFKILLLGKFGQLGWELLRSLAPLGQVTAVDFPEIDLVHGEQLPVLVRDCQPQVIINATAYTAVDRAESEPELAMAINAGAPGLMAELAAQCGAAFIHFSTDYVFDGQKSSPYVETDPTNPLNIYGRSKLEGEKTALQAHSKSLIFRTSWVYSLRKESFVTKVLAWSRQHKTLRVVSDQVSNPTWARMLAEITAQVVARGGRQPAGWLNERGGVYHLAGSGYASRLEWAQAILRFDPRPEEQTTTELLPASTTDFPTPAARPLFSALDCSLFESVFDLYLPNWLPSLKLAMDLS